MKSFMRAAIFLLGCGLSPSLWADVYAYTDTDGGLSLSNMQTDERYTLMVEEPKPAVVAEPAPAPSPAPPVLARKAGYERVVEDVSRSYGVESALLHAVISVESRYNPKAVSHRGATGLMQLMPATAKRYGVANAFDPAQNIKGGARYLRDLLELFDNNMSLALAAYNAGEQAVFRHGKRIPPYRETRNYVSKVLNYYQRYRSDF